MIFLYLESQILFLNTAALPLSELTWALDYAMRLAQTAPALKSFSIRPQHEIKLYCSDASPYTVLEKPPYGLIEFGNECELEFYFERGELVLRGNFQGETLCSKVLNLSHFPNLNC